MQIEHSDYWKRKRLYRKDIRDDLIGYVIQNSSILKDRNWEDVLNAISRVPPSGRLLKVVYKRKGDKIIIITAFWLD